MSSFLTTAHVPVTAAIGALGSAVGSGVSALNSGLRTYYPLLGTAHSLYNLYSRSGYPTSFNSGRDQGGVYYRGYNSVFRYRGAGPRFVRSKFGRNRFFRRRIVKPRYRFKFFA